MHAIAQQKEYKSTHKVFAGLLLGQYLLSIAIGIVTDTLLMGAGIGLVIILVPIFLGITQASSALSRHSVAIAIQLMAALHIQQTMGMTEMHFQVFVLLALLLTSEIGKF